MKKKACSLFLLNVWRPKIKFFLENDTSYYTKRPMDLSPRLGAA